MWINERRRPHAFVCITGQLSRLELDGKIQNLFEPLYNTHRIDVAFVLSTETSYRAPKIHRSFLHEEASAFSSFNEIHAKLPLKYGMVRILKFDQPDSPMLNFDYVDLLDKKSMNRTLQEARSRSHIRQWYAYQNCLAMIDRFERVLQKRYHIVMRMREDLYIARPADINYLLGNVRRQTLLVPSCDSWKGMNDKLAFFHRDTAVKYFMTPLQQFYLHSQSVFDLRGTRRVHNPETYLLRVFERVGLNVVNVTGDKLLAIPTLSLSTGSCFAMGPTSLKCLGREVGQEVLLYLEANLCK